MTAPSREAVEAAVEARDHDLFVWQGYGRKWYIRDRRKEGCADFLSVHETQDAADGELERIHAAASLTAALPHLLAAKDAEIAALPKQRDELVSLKNDLSGALQSSTEDHRCGHARIAALRPTAELLAKIDCLIDEKDEKRGRAFDLWSDDRVVFGIGSDRVITVGDLRSARAALEMSGGVK